MTALSVRVCMALGDAWQLVLLGLLAGVVLTLLGQVAYRTRRR
jgi:hypothetical protein